MTSFYSRFQSFQILHRGWKPDARHPVLRRKLHLSPPHRLVVRVCRSSDAHLASVFSLKRGNSEGKVRRRRRVLKTHTFVDDEGCIGMEPDSPFYRFNLQLQKTQISLCRVQQWRIKSTKVSRTLNPKTTSSPPNKLVKAPPQQNQQPATNRRTRKATRKVLQMQIKERSRLPSWDSSRRNDDWRETNTRRGGGRLWSHRPDLSLLSLINTLKSMFSF